MEDRFQAIRAAIGTAAPGDVVLLAGRGHRDHVEHFDGEDGIARGWFDDRWVPDTANSAVAWSRCTWAFGLVWLKQCN
jgi:hypothetical protein